MCKMDDFSDGALCSVVSYNLHGFNQGVSILPNILSLYDVVCVQEHWLFPFDLNKLSAISDKFVTFSCSSMSDVISNGTFKGRPYGGLAVFVKKDLCSDISLLHTHDRFMIVRIGQICLCNVYLPSNDIDIYKSTLSEISVILSNYKGILHTMVCGDFNTEFCYDSKRWKCVKSFLSVNDLATTDNFIKPVANFYTYKHQSLNHSSFIDHFIVSNILLPRICSLDVIDSGINLSDHQPIVLHCKLLEYVSKSRLANVTLKNNNVQVPIFRWDKSDTQAYYSETCSLLYPIFTQLSAILTQIGQCAQLPSDVDVVVLTFYIENLYNSFVSCLLGASDKWIVKKNTNFFKHWWCEILSELKYKSCEAYKLWCAGGKPRQGTLYNSMMSAKLVYKRHLKQIRQDKEKHISDKLANNLNNADFKSFWKTFNAKCKSNNVCAVSVDGCLNNSDIAEKFSNFFCNVCSPNDNNLHKQSDMELTSEFKKLQGDNGFYSVCIDDIDLAVKSLKKGKAAGFDNLTVEHILHAHPVALSCIKLLFNLMFRCGYVPDAFGKGILIPLLKSPELDHSKSSNYRGLTISPVISKLFEIVLLNMLKTKLVTSELQFGFKKNVGCCDALFTLHSVISYYTTCGNMSVSLHGMCLRRLIECVTPSYY